MKKISLEELLKNRKNSSYQEQYRYVCELIRAGKITAIKSSAKNGKSPALPLFYKIVEAKKDYSQFVHELQFEISTQISPDYYRKHLDVYEVEREWVLQLSNYLKTASRQDKEIEMSLNERSFQIWNREKFLQKENGKQVLKHCGLSLEQLNLYHTSEPLAYYSSSRKTPQNILIIENKDTFYSMRRFLIQWNSEEKGMPTKEPGILGVPIQTLVYGAGKGILRSMEDFSFCVEPYMNCRDNQYLYFGDLDYEGIGIYERLAQLLCPKHKLIPFVEGYEKMLVKAESCNRLPETKEGQNRNLTGHFETFFQEESIKKMRNILEAEKYIPQEILNVSDFVPEGKSISWDRGKIDAI